MKYYVFDADTNRLIGTYHKNQFDKEKVLKKYKIVTEEYDTGVDAFGNEFNFLNIFVKHNGGKKI